MITGDINEEVGKVKQEIKSKKLKNCIEYISEVTH